MPSCLSPFRTALRPTKKYRCARRALFLPLAPVTCTEMCRQSFLPPSSLLYAPLPLGSSRPPMGLPVSPIRNPAASLPWTPAQCFPALCRGAPHHFDVPCLTRPQSASRISTPAPVAAALSPVAWLASHLRHTPSLESQSHFDGLHRRARRCGDDLGWRWFWLLARSAVCRQDQRRTSRGES